MRRNPNKPPLIGMQTNSQLAYLDFPCRMLGEKVENIAYQIEPSLRAFLEEHPKGPPSKAQAALHEYPSGLTALPA